MKLENYRISKQINIYLAAIFIIVLILTISSFINVSSLWESTSDLYNHPLTVQKAVGDIKVNVLLIHRDMRQLPFEENQQEIERLLRDIDAYEADIDHKLGTLYDRYLGPHIDIDNASVALNQWETIRNETVRLFREGQIDEVQNRVKSGGVGGSQADKVISYLDIISDFATNKSEALFQDAQDERNQISGQLTFLTIGMFTLLMFISYYLRKGILPPLSKLTNAAEAINNGEFNVLVQNESPNELGELSRTFNSMSETIQREMKLKEKSLLISSVMFKHKALQPFCNELLRILLESTGSQMSAIYFLNESEGKYEKYESIGVKSDTLPSFSAIGKDGEFGAVLASKKVQHLTEIPEDVQIIFSTVSGEYKMKEIISIPIINGVEVVSIISLASIKNYSQDSINLINSLVNEITASMNAVLASQQVIDFSQKLQITNSELEQQTKELAMQTDELTAQNAELEMQKKQLDEASRLKTNFLSNMSHELRTPLNSVIALSGVLSRRLVDKIPEEESSYLEIIERNGKNLLKLINDILDISRIEAGREEIEITKFNVNHSVSEVLEMLETQAKHQDTELIHKSKEIEVVINSDVDKIRHIIQNLVGNAVKFTEKGSVEIEATQSGDSIEITVTDTGIGIPEEHLPYIFDEFRQADGSTSRRFGGTGLGLAISKKYANLLGGSITVKSKPDVGSEFRLILPMHYSEKNRVVEQSKIESFDTENNAYKRSDFFDLKDKIVLLVEDNESSIIQVRDVVEEIGCQVQVAHDAVEAFDIIEQTIPDAIILDLMMPDVDGFKVLEILRNADVTANIPVLILTAKHITKDELRFLKRNNVHQLIQKGDVRRQDLQQTVANILLPDSILGKKTSLEPQLIINRPVVLVVEDNPDNMTTVKALLEEHHTILEAVNAHEGIEIAKRDLPNLILMDIALPDMNGIDAFKVIRKMPNLQHIPVIALTASVMKHDRETILSHGFDAFIAKPIISNEFYMVIREVLYGK